MFHKSLRAFVVLLALSPAVFLFQNCGEGFVARNGDVDIQSLLSKIQITARPTAMINTRDSVVEFSLLPDLLARTTQTMCSLDTSVPASCSNRFEMNSLADGSHVVSISAVDADGASLDQISVSFSVDATAPNVVINSGPSTVTSMTSAAIAFTANDNLSGVATVQCSLDNAAFAACSSPLNLTNLSQANHSLRVQVVDNAGNMSAVATHDWRVDLNAVVINITRSPGIYSNLSFANFEFNATDGAQQLTQFECSLDVAAFAPCTSPQVPSMLADGRHTFAIRARDTAGVFSQPINYNWTVDTVAPTASYISGPPPLTSDATVSITFEGVDSGSGIARLECSLDDGAFATCVSPQNISNTLTTGHIFRFRSIDKAGNVSTVNSTAVWTNSVPISLANVKRMRFFGSTVFISFKNQNYTEIHSVAANGTFTFVRRLTHANRPLDVYYVNDHFFALLDNGQVEIWSGATLAGLTLRNSVFLASAPSDSNVEKMAVQNNYLYIAGGSSGLYQLNLANAATAVQGSFVNIYNPIGGINGAIAVGTTHIYAIIGTNLVQIINVSNPASVIFGFGNTYCSYSVPPTNNNADYTVVGNFVFGASCSLFAMNAQNPQDPNGIAFLPLGAFDQFRSVAARSAEAAYYVVGDLFIGKANLQTRMHTGALVFFNQDLESIKYHNGKLYAVTETQVLVLAPF